jgi:hypothetical protein
VDGRGYQIETVDDFVFEWYGFPADWNGNLSLRAANAQFVFDDNGRFLGVGIGDEQTSVDYRQDVGG